MVDGVVPHFPGTAGAVGAGNEGATGGAGGRYTDPLKRLQLQLQLRSSHHCWALMQSSTSYVWVKLQEKKKEKHCQSKRYVKNFHILFLYPFGEIK